jgi:hypothetical protein
VVAADPWRPMRVWAGPATDALTARGDAAAPATVGWLVEPLGGGVTGRWDDGGVITVRIEGRSLESRSALAVLGGANGLLIEGAAGWELVQFRQAELVAGETWRLTGLLRGQQGTVATAAEAGATVVAPEAGLARMNAARAERGAPLIWRAGPAEGPAGGAATSEVVFAVEGLTERPWAPCHPRVETRADGGRQLSWIPRSRIDGDRWGGETGSSDPMRFRVRVLDGDLVVRVFEVEETTAVYDAATLDVDFPDGPGGGAVVAIAQWGQEYGGWGREVRSPLT